MRRWIVSGAPGRERAGGGGVGEVKLVALLLMAVNIQFGLSMQAPCNNEGLPEFTKGWTDSETTQFRSLTFQIVTESTLPSVLLTRPGNTQKCIGSGLQLILRFRLAGVSRYLGLRDKSTKSVFTDAAVGSLDAQWAASFTSCWCLRWFWD
jgi:hypothetical protein